MQKLKLGFRVALVLIILLMVFYVTQYGYAYHLCSKISQGCDIYTVFGNLTTAPVWCDQWFAIMQVDGVKIPLVEACYYRNIQAVSVLLNNGADPNFFLNGRMSPIEAALWNGPAGPIDEKSLVILKMLIDAGADVNLHASDKPIIDQLSANMLPDNEARESAFLLLLNHGASENPSESANILHNIVRSGNVKLTRKLITEYGFSVNSVGHQGQTPLILAVYYGQYNSGASATADMIQMLIECHADKHAVDNYGKSALDYAIEYGFDNIVMYLE